MLQIIFSFVPLDMTQSKVSLAKAIVFSLCSCLLVACEGRYQEGYERGYSDGAMASELKFGEELKREREKNRDLQSQIQELEGQIHTSHYDSYSTEVCGGGGVNVSGKYHAPGKTGCVRVFSDGRIERY